LKKNLLMLFIDKLFLFPLWVKQIIYLRLHQNLSLFLSEDFISTREDSVFHLYIPTLSFICKTELEEEIVKFNQQNNVLKEQIGKVLAVVEKNG